MHQSDTEITRRAWDERARKDLPYVDTAEERDFQNPLSVVDQCGWLGGDVVGKRLLCLAAGGGRHSVLFASAGAIVTVVDLSPEMLAIDRKVAAERGLSISVVEASMNNLSMFAEGVFEIVVQPVSTCYTKDILTVYREVARVIAPGGVYVSQHKQPTALQTEYDAAAKHYKLAEPYHRQGPLPPAPKESLLREAGTLEYLHRWEEMLGGLCKAGFVIEDIAEPRHADPEAAPGSFRHRAYYTPPFIKIKARRNSHPISQEVPRKLWTP